MSYSPSSLSLSLSSFLLQVSTSSADVIFRASFDTIRDFLQPSVIPGVTISNLPRGPTYCCKSGIRLIDITSGWSMKGVKGLMFVPDAALIRCSLQG
jgi:hypothetical protein